MGSKRTEDMNVNDVKRCNNVMENELGGVRRAANNRREPVSTNLLLVRRISL